MKTNLHNVGRFVACDTVDYTVVGGAVGWVDTALSAHAGSGRLHVFGTYNAGGGACGVRPHGSAAVPIARAYNTVFSYDDGSGHVDFYRIGSDGIYKYLGYFEL